ncbi:MAG: HEAT repeat domain-containing protein [Sandaracinaceae bacterium]|nr:HEAT repeat domain-containing protein [Sandaracinaceae bacterium]
MADKRAQAPDRWDAIQSLSRFLSQGPKESSAERASAVVGALLPRFTYYTDPTITDQEEKDLAFRVVIEAGANGVPAIRAFMQRSESLVWPLKMLDRLLSPSEVTTELLALLESMDTEYQRDPQRKLQLLQALEERRDPRIGPAVSRFFEDVNETARFHAVGAVLAQEDAATHRDAATALLPGEESVRVKSRVLERFAERGWELGVARASIEKHPPQGWTVSAAGVPARR